VKKEPFLDTVPESDSEHESQAVSSVPRSKLAARRRRANTVHSDGMLATDRKQRVGPYQLSRANSANSATSMGSSAESLTHKTSDARLREAASSRRREPRRVRSETASPLISGNGFGSGTGSLPPLDLSNIEYPPYMANSSFDLFGSMSDADAPIYSAGLSTASVDWSHLDWSKANGDNFAPSSYSQAGNQNYNSMFDFGSGSEQLPRLANTTSTSGDVSEVEDFMPGAEGDFDSFGPGNGFIRPGMMEPATDISSIDYSNFYKGADHAPMIGSGMSMVEDDPAFWIANYKTDGMMEENPDPLAVGSGHGTNYWES
jgi:hypothetical protein